MKVNAKDMETVVSLIRATQAVCGIPEDSLIEVRTRLPMLTPEGEVATLEVNAWMCGSCTDIHTTVTRETRSVFVVTDETLSQEEPWLNDPPSEA